MDPRLAAVAARQGGVFRVGEALRAGYSEGRVRHLLATGVWSRVRRGICVESAVLEAADPVRRYALRVAAAVLAVAGDAVASHESAAVLHGIALLDPPAEDEVTLTRAAGSSHRHRAAGTRIHLGEVSPGQVWMRLGVPVTGPARTVADLARWLPFEAAVVAADSAMRGLSVGRAELESIVAGFGGLRGAGQAERVVRAADPRTRSPLETLGRLMCADAGLPAPEVGVLMGDERGIRTEVDLYWRVPGVIVLFDGMFKYDDPWTNRKEKLVQEWLENAGLVVVRLTWSDVTRHRARSIERVRAAFQRARVRGRSA